MKEQVHNTVTGDCNNLLLTQAPTVNLAGRLNAHTVDPFLEVPEWDLRPRSSRVDLHTVGPDSAVIAYSFWRSRRMTKPHPSAHSNKIKNTLSPSSHRRVE